MNTTTTSSGSASRLTRTLLLPVLIVLALFAAACGNDDDAEPVATPDPSEPEAPDPPDAADTADGEDTAAQEEETAETDEQIGGDVNLYNWTDYISEDLLARFSEETGIKVNLSNYDSNESMLATLAAGATGYDVIVPSDYIIPLLIEQELIQPIDAFALDNAAHIDPAFLDPYFDVGRVYTAPYLYGTTGLAVDTSQVPDPPDSWAEFFAVPEGSHGSIGMMNDQVRGGPRRAAGCRR